MLAHLLALAAFHHGKKNPLLMLKILLSMSKVKFLTSKVDFFGNVKAALGQKQNVVYPPLSSY